MDSTTSRTRVLVQVGLLTALSIVGASVKIQGSIAFDSLPAFFAALYLGPVAGGLIGFLGHMLSAVTAGFPYTLPLHLFVALQMFAVIWVFGKVYQKVGMKTAIAAGILLNGPVSTLLSSYLAVGLGLPFSGMAMMLALWLPITVASILNIAIAVVLFKALDGKIR